MNLQEGKVYTKSNSAICVKVLNVIDRAETYTTCYVAILNKNSSRIYECCKTKLTNRAVENWIEHE